MTDGRATVLPFVIFVLIRILTKTEEYKLYLNVKSCTESVFTGGEISENSINRNVMFTFNGIHTQLKAIYTRLYRPF